MSSSDIKQIDNLVLNDVEGRPDNLEVPRSFIGNDQQLVNSVDGSFPIEIKDSPLVSTSVEDNSIQGSMNVEDNSIRGSTNVEDNPIRGSTNVEDGLIAAEKADMDRKERQKRREQIIKENQQGAEILQSYVDNNANPNPVFVIFLVVICISLIYLMYIIFIKSNLQGRWVSSNGQLYYVDQNCFTNRLVFSGVKGNDEILLKGKLVGNYVELNSKYFGIWNGTDKIFFLDGDVLRRVVI